MELIRWKIVVMVATFAMALSFLSGGLAGISFGILIRRALIAGGVFGLLTILFHQLIRRFFPELLEKETKSGDDSDLSASRIDIMMPAEKPGNLGEEEESMGKDAEQGFGHRDENLSMERSQFKSEGYEDEFFHSNEPYEGEDPQKLAQAIKTVIKRDEES